MNPLLRAAVRNTAYQAEEPRRLDLVKARYSTEDIMGEISDCQAENWQQASELAPLLQAGSTYETAKLIWGFIRKVARYEADPIGKQASKSPARTLKDGFGDCKAYAILGGSILQAMEIPWLFRFVSYDKGPFTHVYLVVKDGKEEIPLDPCLPTFSEKPYRQKRDIMPLYRISGVIEESTYLLDESTTDTDFAAQIILEREQLKRELAAEAGAAPAVDGIYGARIGFLRKVFRRNPEKKEARQEKKAAKKETKAAKKAAGNTTGQKILRVISAPARAGISLILTALLPKAAPFFLYLFLNDQKTISAMPLAEQRKRGKAVKIADVIIQKTNISRAQFMGIIRNGIMKQFRQTPEEVLASAMSGAIGDVGAIPAVLASAIPVLKQIISKIVSLFKGTKIDFADGDAPNLSALAGGSPAPGSGKSGGSRMGPSPGGRLSEAFRQETQAKVNTGILRPSDISPSTANLDSSAPTKGGGSKTMLYVGLGVAALGTIFLITKK